MDGQGFDPAERRTFDVDLDRLEVVRTLGAGAFGEVLLARRRLPDGGAWPVALKVLREADPRRVERFRREAELTSRLDHPGIVRVHGAGTYRGRPAIVYEFVEGARPLSEVTRTLPLVTRLGCVREVASALAHAHEQGVLHRDVKAENVLVAPDGRALLADFGLAVGVDSRTLTQTGQLLGTPYAMSPEQLTGKEATAASDVWGLGVLLHLVVTGERPFGGDTWTTLAAEVLRSDAPRPSTCAEGVPAGVDALVARALAKEPADRPAAAEVAAALEAALEAGPEAPRGRGLVAPLAVAATAAVGLALLAVVAARPTPEPSSTAPVATTTLAAPAPVASAVAPVDPSRFAGWVAQFAQATPFRLTVEQRAVARDDVGHRLRLDGVLGPYATETTMQLDKVSVGMLRLTTSALRVEDLGVGHVFDSSDPARPEPGAGPLPDLTRYAEALARVESGLLLNPRNGQIMGHSSLPRRPNVRAELQDPSSPMTSAWGAGIPDGGALVQLFQSLTQLLCLDHQPKRRRRLVLTPVDTLEGLLRLDELEPGVLRVVSDGPLERVGDAPTGDRPTLSGRVRLAGGRLTEVSYEVTFDTAGDVPSREVVRRRVTASLRLGDLR